MFLIKIKNVFVPISRASKGSINVPLFMCLSTSSIYIWLILTLLKQIIDVSKNYLN